MALVALSLGGWILTGCGTATAPAVEPTATSTLATAAQVEERYGVEVRLVGVTAGGGLIDVRFRIADPARAGWLLQADSLPLLVVEKSGTVLRVSEPPDQDALIQGRVYSLLYPNANNAIEPGDQVSLIIGTLRLEHIPAQ